MSYSKHTNTTALDFPRGTNPKHLLQLLSIFTARRYATVVYVVALCPLFVSLSVANRYCNAISKRRIVQRTSGTLPFWRKRSWWNSN